MTNALKTINKLANGKAAAAAANAVVANSGASLPVVKVAANAVAAAALNGASSSTVEKAEAAGTAAAAAARANGKTNAQAAKEGQAAAAAALSPNESKTQALTRVQTTITELQKLLANAKNANKPGIQANISLKEQERSNIESGKVAVGGRKRRAHTRSRRNRRNTKKNRKNRA